MSAFLCSAFHISAIVNSVSARDLQSGLQRAKALGRTSPSDAFKLLAKANADSVDYRYDETAFTAEIAGYRYDPMAQVQPIEAIKAVHCLEYQSCEVEDWEETPAARLLRHIEGDIIRTLPGYDDAPWGLEDRPHSGAINLTDLLIKRGL